ncbi:hypothetical protein HZC30_01480 [Candidatus Woesearchaeota archaeon]|nr:hypothetical protein [Candidatus Woesearchaeota archaeon]
MPVEITLELPHAHRGDFREFLHRHRRVDSFQEVDGCFMVRVIPQDSPEFHAFVRGIKKTFQVSVVKETPLCQGTCRNGTNCFNRDKYEGYCFHHRKVSEGVGERDINPAHQVME